MPIEQKTIDALKWIVPLFDKHAIPYQISGGFAAKLYGSSRPLNDIDFDVPERCFEALLPELSGYVTFGPGCFKDAKWDTELITLEYRGQTIDIAGSETMLISNKERTKWIPSKGGPFDSVSVDFEGLKLNVVHPAELIEYKKELDGEHQQEDIRAVERYLRND